MWATDPNAEHEGITGITFDSDGHRLVGTLYLARGGEPKPTALLLRAVAVYGAVMHLGVPFALTQEQLESEFTRFLATTPGEFAAQRAEAQERMDPLEAAAAISPRPLLVVHGTADAWVPVQQGRELRARARPPCRYVEVEGANHSFSWHRAGLRDLIAGWLDEACN